MEVSQLAGARGAVLPMLYLTNPLFFSSSRNRHSKVSGQGSGNQDAVFFAAERRLITAITGTASLRTAVTAGATTRRVRRRRTAISASGTRAP